MTNSKDIETHLELLSQYRNNLRILLHQEASHGSFTTTPLIVLNDIRQNRSEIKRAKEFLRNRGHIIDDLLIDEPTSWDWEQFDENLNDHFNWGEAKHRYLADMKKRYGSMRILGMDAPVPLDNIFTDVYLHSRLSASQRYSIDELKKHGDWDERWYSPNSKRKNGVSEVRTQQFLYILGRPGAGKTTFLKYLTLQAIEGVIDAIPIFIALKIWADSRLNLMDFLINQFAICSFPNARPFIENILSSGKAIVLFDGLDEISQEQIDTLNPIQSIINFCEQYNNNRYVITCRIAASKHQFEQFTYCELADFNTVQVRTFVTRWFQADPSKCQAFLAEFSLPEHSGLRDLARTPLLLTLLCLNFEETMSFPARRAEIYDEALNALLKKWDSSRSIKRDIKYRQLSLDHKRKLLMYIAYENFKRQQIFLEQSKLEKQIISYMRKIPSNDDSKMIDGEEIINAIEAQHGLLIERAHGIYSFSHIAFHEYFTARYIVEHPSNRIFREVTNKVYDLLWREIIILVSSMLDEAYTSAFFQSFHTSLYKSILKKTTLTSLFKWANLRAKTIGNLSFSTILFYIRSRMSMILIKQVANASNLLSDHAIDYAINDTLLVATTFNRTNFLALQSSSFINFDPDLNIDLNLDLTIDKAIAIANSLSYNITGDMKPYAIDIKFDHELQLASTLATILASIPKNYVSDRVFEELQTTWSSIRDSTYLAPLEQKKVKSKLQQLSLPSVQASQDDWIDFSEQLHIIILEHRDIDHEWTFDENSWDILDGYLSGISLLLECLKLATIADRQHVYSWLLVPPSSL